MEFGIAKGGPVVDAEIGCVGAVVDFEEVVFVVALGGEETGIADEAADHGVVEAMRGAGGGDDIFLHHHGAHVIGSVEEAGLADVGTHGDPTGADGEDVVEVEAGKGLGAEVIGGAGHADTTAEEGMGGFLAGAVEFGDDITGERVIEIVALGGSPFGTAAERGIFALEGPGDEGLVSSSAGGGEIGDGGVLPGADEFEVVDAVGNAFEVAEHHGGGGIHAEFVGYAHGGEPGGGIALAEADFSADGIGEDFSATAGNGI